MGVILTTYEPGVPSSKGCWIDTLTGVAPDAIMARLKGWKPGSPTSYGNPHWLPGIGATPNPKVTGPHNYQLYTNNCWKGRFSPIFGLSKITPPASELHAPPPKKNHATCGPFRARRHWHNWTRAPWTWWSRVWEPNFPSLDVSPTDPPKKYLAAEKWTLAPNKDLSYFQLFASCCFKKKGAFKHDHRMAANSLGKKLGKTPRF